VQPQRGAARRRPIIRAGIFEVGGHLGLVLDRRPHTQQIAAAPASQTRPRHPNPRSDGPLESPVSALTAKTPCTLGAVTIEAGSVRSRHSSANNKAAEQHENAAKSHRAAADAHGKNDHAKGKEHSTQAQQHSQIARNQSQTAHEKSQQQK